MNKEEENQVPDKSKLSLKDFFSMGDVGRYFFRGKNHSKPTNINIKLMHGINRLAIIIFLFALIYIVFKFYLF